MRTSPRLRFACAAVLAAAGVVGSAAAASITLYKQADFTGGQVTLNGATPSLAPHGIMDQASSITLDSPWEVCSQPNFGGDCRVLGAGRYATLDQSLNHRIESARPAPGRKVTYDLGLEPPVREARRDDDRSDSRRDGDRGDYRRDGRRDNDRDGRWGPRERGSIDIFPSADFRGRPMHVEGDAATLAQLADRGSSVIVHEGTWQLCSQEYFEGNCRTFEPGRYRSLGRLDNNVASAKQIIVR